MTLAPTRTENRRLPAPSLLDLLLDLQAAAHEYIRALAIGEWRAGAVTAAEAEARSFALLAEAGVLPRPALLASLASLHAGEGGVRAGAEALSRLSARRGAPRPREGAFLALLQAACSVDEAAEAFRAMARSRVAPTLRSRAALVEALLRLRSGGGDKSGGGGKGGGGRAPPGAESFWRALPFPRDEALASFRASGVGVADVADLLLEAQAAALLQSLGDLAAEGSSAPSLPRHLRDLADAVAAGGGGRGGRSVSGD
uniref:Uncharacterized protein n=1 Tax=Emiliania huxleyi TaxID=2903 RepID=A0A7S3SPV5_EMIHU